MIRKLSSIALSDIVIPNTLITETSKSELSFISESLKAKSELFFVTLLKQDEKYVLVDRYDVYLASIESGIKEISAVIIQSKSDNIKSHFQITVKSVMNPVKIINSMRNYVEEFGLDETVKKLHLNSDFAQMYKLEIDQNVLDILNGMISELYRFGIRTAVPLTLFTFISKLEKEQQLIFLESLGHIVKESNRYFRWPHNKFLKKLNAGYDDTVKKIPEKKLKVLDVNFCCDKCDTEYVVIDGVVNKKEEYQDMIIHHKSDNSTPRITIPDELIAHLGVTQKNPPKIISSTDIDIQKISAQLNGRKFIILIGEKQGK